METKYKKGEIVFERVNPALKLIVSSHVNGIYYCRPYETQARKELAFLERDLRSILTTTTKK